MTNELDPLAHAKDTLLALFAIKPWIAVADFNTVAGELNLSLVEELRRHGIGTPYPQREVRLIGGSA
jgi:small-conductance mechanosensitive channel